MYFFVGKALFHINDLHRAKDVVLKAKALKQGDSDIAKLLVELDKRLKVEKQQETDL